MGPSGEMAEANLSSGAWCGGEDKLPSDIRVCSGARPGGGWEMLDNQSHDSSENAVPGKQTSGLRCDHCKAGKRCDLSGLQTAGANWPQLHTGWLSSEFSVNEEVEMTVL